MISKLLKLGHIRRYVLGLFDLLCYILADAVVFLLLSAFDNGHCSNTSYYILNSLIMLAFISSCRLIIGVYGYVWRYPSTFAYFRLSIADFIGASISAVVIYVIGSYRYDALWHYLVTPLLTLFFALMSRFCYRLVYKYNRDEISDGKPHINVAIVGAGQIGALLASDLSCNKNQIYKPVFFIDNDRAKIGSKVSGLNVYANDDNIKELVNKYSIGEIIIAINNIDNEKADYLYTHYSETGCRVKLFDAPIHDTDNSSANKQRVIREFQIEDLLFRNPLSINDSRAFRYYAGKTVLVTGGGGSIGSELCRQIAKCNPRKLIIFDIYENNAYDIQQELTREYGDILDLVVEIGSVRDRHRLENVFQKHNPDIIFHAAAHKHVPLMESSACEAIKNNVFGTYNTADLAEKYKAEKFILISTDKAVNPTNIMGASKRLCEFVVQSRFDSKTTNFAAVRFGNVLGSNGSVIPLFKKQIAGGGPITITDKRIIRYFMTIPEASQLVMQAGAMAKTGELFVLDMGKPVRIYDLAVNMIKLSGLEPEKDIKIEEVGLRPGEKLYEELLMKSETLNKTDNNMIFIEKDNPPTRSEVEEFINQFKGLILKLDSDNDVEPIKEMLKKTVPTFRTPDEINSDAESSSEMKMTMAR